MRGGSWRTSSLFSPTVGDDDLAFRVDAADDTEFVMVMEFAIKSTLEPQHARLIDEIDNKGVIDQQLAVFSQTNKPFGQQPTSTRH